MQTTQQETIRADTLSEKYLVFQIGSESYGMPLLQVQEIRSYTPATRVPASMGADSPSSPKRCAP